MFNFIKILKWNIYLAYLLTKGLIQVWKILIFFNLSLEICYHSALFFFKMSEGKKGGDTLKSVSQNSTPENLNHSNTQSLSVCLQTSKSFTLIMWINKRIRTKLLKAFINTNRGLCKSSFPNLSTIYKSGKSLRS